MFCALIALAADSFSQTYLTVTADSNRVIRTNYTLVFSQITDLTNATFAISNITSLQTALDDKLATNGSAASLSNFPSYLLQTNGDAAGLTNFPTLNQSTTGTASNVTGVVEVVNGGTGASDTTNARINLLPSYTANYILAVNTNATDVEWVVNSAQGDWWTNAPTTNVSFTTNTGSADQILALSTNLVDLYWTDAPSGGGGFLNASNAILIGTNVNSVSTNATAQSNSITIGNTLTNHQDNILIGSQQNYYYEPVASNAIAIGHKARLGNHKSIAIGYDASVRYGAQGNVCIGAAAQTGSSLGAYNGVQLGDGIVGSNSVTGNCFQVYDWGVMYQNDWQAVANSTDAGKDLMQIGDPSASNKVILSSGTIGQDTLWTNATALMPILVTGTNYITTNVSVVGTNNTNTLVFSNGILVEVTTP